MENFRDFLRFVFAVKVFGGAARRNTPKQKMNCILSAPITTKRLMVIIVAIGSIFFAVSQVVNWISKEEQQPIVYTPENRDSIAAPYVRLLTEMFLKMDSATQARLTLNYTAMKRSDSLHYAWLLKNKDREKSIDSVYSADVLLLLHEWAARYDR